VKKPKIGSKNRTNPKTGLSIKKSVKPQITSFFIYKNFLENCT
jgi:hypothetical protein